MMSSDQKISLFKQLLTTTTLGMVLPSFKEEYTGREMVDIVGTLNEKFLMEHIPVEIVPAKVSLGEDGTL